MDKKNIKISVLAVVLAVVLTASILIFALKPWDKKNFDNTHIIDSGFSAPKNTVHIYNVRETNIDFVTNGTTKYKILKPAAMSEKILFAVEELKLFFKEATGIVLDECSDVEYNSEASYISLGDTALLRNKKIEADTSKLGNCGFRIVTEDQSIFIAGSELGIIYGVYEFLYRIVGYRIYADDVYAINKNVTNLKLPAFDITDIPDFEWRQGSYGITFQNKVNARRFNVNSSEEIWIMPASGRFVHNYLTYVPPAKYNNPQVVEDYHPEWFSEGNDGGQLCFSRDPDGLLEVVTESAIRYIKENQDADNLSFTQQDSSGWCNCDNCTESFVKYGTNAAVMIQFANRLARNIKEYCDNEENGRKIKLTIFAYQETVSAPVKVANDSEGNAILDADGETVFEPIDESVVFEDNLVLLYAPEIMQIMYGLKEPQNYIVDLTIKQWSCLTSEFNFWFYGMVSQHYLAPLDTFNAIQSIMLYAKSYNANYIFYQAQHDQNIPADWGILKNYIITRLLWDCTLDLEYLIKDFCLNYFGEAADAMKNYLDHYRADYFNARLNSTKNIICWSPPLIFKENFSRGMLIGWINKANEAFVSIESLKVDNPERYEILEKRILLESIAPRYILISLYGSMYHTDVLLNMKLEFKKDVERLGIEQSSERKSIRNLWTLWGI